MHGALIGLRDGYQISKLPISQVENAGLQEDMTMMVDNIAPTGLTIGEWRVILHHSYEGKL